MNATLTKSSHLALRRFDVMSTHPARATFTALQWTALAQRLWHACSTVDGFKSDIGRRLTSKYFDRALECERNADKARALRAGRAS